jgi:hypothetical protein
MELEERMNFARTRRSAVPVSFLFFIGLTAILLGDRIMAVPLASIGAVWMAAFLIAAGAGLVWNERSARRTISSVKPDLDVLERILERGASNAPE